MNAKIPPHREIFDFKILQGNSVTAFTIWNGIKDYSNIPPTNVINYVASRSTKQPANVAIVQLKRLNKKTIQTLKGTAPTILIWMRDHKAYEDAKKFVKNFCDYKLQ